MVLIARTLSFVGVVQFATGFAPSKLTGISVMRQLSSTSSAFHAVKLKEPPIQAEIVSFDPLGLSEITDTSFVRSYSTDGSQNKHHAWIGSALLAGAMTLADPAQATSIEMPRELMNSANFDPNSFVPVCGASDNFYRVLQGTAKAVVGADNFKEYGPLIASGLLRVRLELCVVESFFNEAVGPFIRENGLSWVLPLHETVETFLAGTVFALATTFILVGSTKLLTVIFTYADFLIGGPMRLFGGFAFDRARGKPVTLDIGFGPFKTRVIGPKDLDTKELENDWSVDLEKVGGTDLVVVILSGVVKAAGKAVGAVRELLDALDLFVGKSLVLWMTAYVGFKFLHFKIFPDFPPL